MRKLKSRFKWLLVVLAVLMIVGTFAATPKASVSEASPGLAEPAQPHGTAQWILLDAPPKPSGGSGVEPSAVGKQVWVELDDFVPDETVLPLLQSDPVVPSGEVTEPLTPAPRIGFNGVINSPTTGTPPDTHIAVGPGLGTAGRVMMVTNGHVQIWDKNGNTIAGPTLLDTVFGTNCYDPKVLYDQHSGRFFMVCLEGTSPSLSNVHIAVSSNGTPNNLTTDWTFTSGSGITTVGSYSTWCDYPGIGADSDSLFTTFNLFDNSSTFRGIKIRVFNKASLIGGVYTFVDIDYDTSVTSVSTTQPAHVYGTTDNGGFYLIGRLGSGTYRIFNITGDPAAPVATTSTHPWSAGTFPADRGADQLGTAVDLDTLASRAMNAIYRTGHIWLCLTADPDNDGETEAVWQDITTNGGPPTAPTVYQFGYINGTGTEPWTYMPSINVNWAGDAAICYTQSSTSQYADVVYTVRSSTDPLGTFQSPVVAKAGPGYYDSFSSRNPDRWGDYSGCVVDPTDDCFWVANEFAWSSAPAASEWGTYIASMCMLPELPEAKWEQPPCLDDPNLCMDVDATDDNWMWYAPQALADDFNCTKTGLITNIHIWGSWLSDEPPDDDPCHVWFTLCLYSNDPCGSGGYSEPNELLWTKEFYEGEFDVEIFAEGPEAYYVPCEPLYMPDSDWTCWLYSFYIDPCESFVQEGDPCNPVVYWLALQAHIYDPNLMQEYRFGWKNSSEQWNDDAVWAQGLLPGALGSWNELRHPMTLESVDLAFKITTEAPPPNDDCANAEPVGNVTDLPFDTTSATFDGSGTCMYSPNIWYCYTATCTGLVTVSLCGSSYDTMLAVYDGCTCDPLGAELGCNDNFCGLQSQITFAATAGNEYLIEVGGQDIETGQGLLTISCEEYLKWSQPPVEIDPNAQTPTYCGWDEPSHREIIGFPCWSWPYQCRGDATGTSFLGRPVTASDLVILKAALGGSYPYPPYNPCADFDRNFVVDHVDVNIMETYYGLPAAAVPICTPGTQNVGTGGVAYWDLFAVSLTPDGNYWDLVDGGAGSLSDPVLSPDPAGASVIDANTPLGGVAWGFGGAAWGDGTLETDAGSHSIVLMNEPNYYLSVVLDTSTTPQYNGLFSSCGTISGIVVTPCDANGDPCGPPIDVNNWVVSPFDPDAGTVVTQGVSSSVTLASNDFGDAEYFDGQGGVGIWGAAAKLPALPPDACGYKVDFVTDLYTWDTYHGAGPPAPEISWMMAADDFRCLGTMPITSVRWWGSYVGWKGSEPPSVQPDAWRIGFWSNVPAGINASYSYPEKLLWQIEVPVIRVEQQWDGNDLSPDPCKPSDSCFEYYVELIRDEIFWQSEFLDQTTDDTFWLSIAAIYPYGTPVNSPWGWKTRSWSWMDDAVVIDITQDPYQGMVLDPMDITPIEYGGESYDVCFELDTDPRWIKWQQAFTGIRDWPHYEDEESWATVDVMGEPNIVRLAADDWPCDTNGSVSAVAWWGSHIGYTYEACQGPPVNLPVKPDYFLLNIWTDVPASDIASVVDDFDSYADNTAIKAVWKDYWSGSLWGRNGAEVFVETTPALVRDGNSMEYYFTNVNKFAGKFVGSEAEANTADLQVGTDWTVGGAEALVLYFYGDPCNLTDTTGVVLGIHQDQMYVALEDGDANVGIVKYPDMNDIKEASWHEWNIDLQDPCLSDVNLANVAKVYIGFGGQKMGQTKYGAGNFFNIGDTVWFDDITLQSSTYQYSHPKDIIWEYRAYDYDEVLVGFDKHPLGAPNEPVFRYSVRLPEPNQFHQEKADGIYWLSVVAVYDGNLPNYPWGWTNHRHVYNDDAVAWTWDDANSIWIWEELFDQTETSEDMSFILFTECLNRDAPGYHNWVSLGKPKCWCYAKQCRGDTNGKSFLGKPVSLVDWNLVKDSFNLLDPLLPAGGECANLDHLRFLNKQVTLIDFNRTKAYFNDPDASVPDCDQAPIITGPYNFWTN